MDGQCCDKHPSAQAKARVLFPNLCVLYMCGSLVSLPAIEAVADEVVWVGCYGLRFLIAKVAQDRSAVLTVEGWFLGHESSFGLIVDRVYIHPVLFYSSARQAIKRRRTT